MEWNSDMEAAPKDRTILVWHDKKSDPYFKEATNHLTTFAAHFEGLQNHMEPNAYPAVWGGEYVGTEDEGYCYVPDWWFFDDGNGETPLAPTHWSYLSKL